MTVLATAANQHHTWFTT